MDTYTRNNAHEQTQVPVLKLKFRKYPAIHITVDQTAPFQTRKI